MEVIVYEKSNCVQCTQTKKLLDKFDINYNTINIETDVEAYNYIVNDLKYKSAPVVVIRYNDEDNTSISWSGFHPENIKDLL
jgi:glutaredoxin-like protein NrdH